MSIILAFLLAANPQPSAPQVSTTVENPDEKICKHIKITGSRVGGKRYCATRLEWQYLEKEAEKQGEDIFKTQVRVPLDN